jgi:hypothetical protein
VIDTISINNKTGDADCRSSPPSKLEPCVKDQECHPPFTSNCDRLYIDTTPDLLTLRNIALSTNVSADNLKINTDGLDSNISRIRPFMSQRVHVDHSLAYTSENLLHRNVPRLHVFEKMHEKVEPWPLDLNNVAAINTTINYFSESDSSDVVVVESHVDFTDDENASEEEQEQQEEDNDNKTVLYPILTKQSYSTTPDMSVICKMNDYELSHVKGFSIRRENIGEIVWNDEVDLRGLNLDNIVTIEHKCIELYGNKCNDEVPLPGNGLNKPLTVKLLNVFPKNKHSSDMNSYIEKLEKACHANKSQFVQYDVSEGTWIFDIPVIQRNNN